MRRRPIALVLGLSASLSLNAYAGPERSPQQEFPGAGQPPRSVTAALDPTWKQLTPTCPVGRMASYAVVDPDRDRMVVFGGWGFGYFSDTWMLDLASGTWTQPPVDSVHPGPRMEYASIHDPVRNRMIVFGGKYPFQNEVWALDLSGTSKWTRLSTAGTPPGPRESRAIYDPVRDRMVVFGGYGSGGFPHLNETWELTLSGTPTWHRLATTGGPPAPRRGQTAILDPAGDRMIVFGGFDDVRFMNDVWALDLSTLAWQQLTPGGNIPPARYGHSATFDPDRREMVVIGGYNREFRNDLWVLSLEGSPTWTGPMSTPVAPRDFHSAVYDATRRRIVVFGGNAGPVFNDLWALDTGTRAWTQLGLNVTLPQPRLGTSMVTDANSQRMVLFGGWGGGYLYLSDTWTLALDQAQPVWISHPSAAHPDVYPSARLEHATAYDATRDRMLMFGGKAGKYFFDGVWQLDLTGDPVWSPLYPTGRSPSPRECRAVYDPVRDRMVIFGGYGPDDGDYDPEYPPPPHHLNETWELTLSGAPAWRQLDPSGPLPPARRGQTMIYDPVDDRALVFGGYDDRTFFNDVWSLSFEGGHEHWRSIMPVGVGPGPRYGASATLDPVRRQMIVFGGYDGHYLDDAWGLSLDRAPKWTRIDSSPHPGKTDFHTMAYDPNRDRFMLFGGNNGQMLGDLWELTFANPVLLPPPVSLDSGDGSVMRVAGTTFEAGSRAPILHLTLPGTSPTRLELFDISGRRLADRSFVPAAAGTNAIRLAEADKLRAGVYLVRVTQGTLSAVGRAVVVP